MEHLNTDHLRCPCCGEPVNMNSDHDCNRVAMLRERQSDCGCAAMPGEVNATPYLGLWREPSWLRQAA